MQHFAIALQISFDVFNLFFSFRDGFFTCFWDGVEVGEDGNVLRDGELEIFKGRFLKAAECWNSCTGFLKIEKGIESEDWKQYF